MYSLLLAIIYLTFISLGLPDSLLGSGWPVMHKALAVPVSYMGIISMLICGGTILSSIYSDALTRKFGTQRVTLVSVFLTAIALLGFSFSNHFYLLIVFAIPYGLGAGAIDAALNNYVALHYSSRDMSLLHCFWGVGTIVSPFVMSYSLKYLTWQNGYQIIGLAQLCITAVLFFTLPLWNIHKKVENKDSVSIGLSEIFQIKGVIPLLIGFFAYCALESTAMGWSATYLVEVRGIEKEVAASFAALFYIGITAGRFFGSFFMNALGDRKMIFIGSGVLLLGIALLFTDIQILSLIGFIIIGLGCAPIYPCIIHSTPDNFGAEYSGSIIGIQMASAYIGSMFMPPLYGVLGNIIGFEILPFYLLFFVLLMIVLVESTFKITKTNT